MNDAILALPAAQIRQLPQSIKLIISTIGLIQTITLLEAHQGRTVKIPERPAEKHKAVCQLGLALVNAILKAYGSGPYQLPMLQKVLTLARNNQIINDLAAGATVESLVTKYTITRQWIMYIRDNHENAPPPKKRQAADENQLALPL